MKISFAHNVQNRHKTLRETIEMEKEHFPDSKIYVAYNDTNFNVNYFDDLDNIKFYHYIGNGHKLGCVNGCIKSIQSTLDDDCDIIIFSHDDVKINPYYIEVFNENIKKIEYNNVDIICRKPNTYGDNYYMMETFFIKKETACTIFNGISLYRDEKQLPCDLRKSYSPEVWLYNVFNQHKTNINIHSIPYIHSNNNYNKILGENLGVIHKNAGLRGWTD